MDNIEELKNFLSIKRYLRDHKQLSIGSLILLGDRSVLLHRTIFIMSEKSPFQTKQKLSDCVNDFVIYQYNNSDYYKNDEDFDITKIIKPHEFLGLTEEEFNKFEAFLLNIDFPKQSVTLKIRERYDGTCEIELSEEYYGMMTATITLTPEQTAELEKKLKTVETDDSKIHYDEIKEENIFYVKDKNISSITYRIDNHDKDKKIMTGNAYLVNNMKQGIKCYSCLEFVNCVKMMCK